MSIFEAVKQSVTTRQVAEHFGIRADRNGMCRCPFHDDRNPSMKVDRRYYCFGCGATGDVIDFVSRLEGISPKEAALLLARAFSVPYEDKGPPRRSHPRPRQESPEQQFKRMERYCLRVLCDYRMAKNKTEIQVTAVFDGELDATDVFVSLIAQKYNQRKDNISLAKTQDLGYNKDKVQQNRVPSGLCG